VRKLIYTVFVAFWAVIATLLLLQTLTTKEPTDTPTPEASASDLESATEAAQHSLSEVASHDRLDDCWLVIRGAVYDVTDYVGRHPAPDDVLAAWCGREATEGMETKGRGREHSARAWRMLERYRIGTLAKAESTN
jgi:cytochrome b involved in lipid metabolism